MSTLRITGGTLRGRVVPLPPHELRPTSSRARQAFFNMVNPEVRGAAFLDLFAGSGIFSFEAVSRGAHSAVAVDSAPRAVKAINDRAAEWRLPIRAVAGDVMAAIGRLAESFSLVYADPPYEWEGYRGLLEFLDRRLPLREGAVIGLEHRSGTPPFDPGATSRLEFRKSVRYGSVGISLFDAPAADGGGAAGGS